MAIQTPTTIPTETGYGDEETYRMNNYGVSTYGHSSEQSD